MYFPNRNCCWWKKSCITWDVENPANSGINYQPQLANAEFPPATVSCNSRDHQSRKPCFFKGFNFGVPFQKGRPTIVYRNFLPCYLTFWLSNVLEKQNKWTLHSLKLTCYLSKEKYRLLSFFSGELLFGFMKLSSKCIYIITLLH